MLRVRIKLSKEVNKIGKELIERAGRLPGEVNMALIEGANIIRNDIIRSMTQEEKHGNWYIRSTQATRRTFKTKGERRKTGAKRKGIMHRASAPGEAPAMDSGELVRSIIYDVENLQVEIGAEAGAPYAVALEEGKGKIAPRPFLQPAIDRNIDEVNQLILRAMGKAMEE